MTRFLEKAAHLSYASPLIAWLIYLQLGAAPATYALVGALIVAGYFSAWAGRASRVPALLGVIANTALVVAGLYALTRSS